MATNRPELEILARRGFKFSDPYDVVTEFEKRVASFYGAPFAVAVDCCTHAVELSLRYLKAKGVVQVPDKTYVSIPMTILKLNCEIQWSHQAWQEMYTLNPYPVVDASLCFRKGSYEAGTFMCLSFQQKKSLPIGRGGMILTDSLEAAEWLKKSSYDGRNRGRAWKQDSIEILGYHYYMTPEDAARGLLLLDEVKDKVHQSGSSQDYPDISKFPVFQKELA